MILTALLLLVTQSAEAANMCKSLASIQSKLEECEDNSAFSEAGEACANSYRARVKAEQAKLQALLKNQTKTSIADKSGKVALQAESEKVSAAAYASAIASVASLIEKGQLARSEVVAYKGNLVWPVQWSVALGPAPTPAQAESVFDGEYCFGEHNDILNDTIADFDKMIAELTAAKVAAEGFQGVSSSNQGNLNGGVVAPQTTGGKNTGVKLPGYSGDPKQRQSDISGTKEEEKPKK